MRKRISVVAYACFVMACGPANNDDPNIQLEPDMGMTQDQGQPSDTGAPDSGIGTDVGEDASTGTDDMGQVEPDMAADLGGEMDMNGEPLCGGVMCAADEECINDLCFVSDSCLSPTDLGTLSADNPLSASGNLATGADTIAANCGDDSRKERVYQFETTEQLQVSWTATWMGQFDGLVELRTACDDAGSVLSCSDIESGAQTLDPGTYFFVLETRVGNAGEFSLEVTAEAASCNPGVSECMGTQLQVCDDPTAPELLDCADSCANGLCGGDTCSNAIAVDATGGGLFSGNGEAYSDELDFGSNNDCTSAGGATIDTPGYEVVFFLPGLEENDIVSIDAETGDSNINAIFVLPACSDTAACTTVFTDERPDWVVDAPGDYYVVIDKQTATSTEFQYSVTVL